MLKLFLKNFEITVAMNQTFVVSCEIFERPLRNNGGRHETKNSRQTVAKQQKFLGQSERIFAVLSEVFLRLSKNNGRH